MKVFSFGGSDADIVGEIPYYAVGVVPIGDCNGEGCHVRYLGLVGFVDARRLRLEASPRALAAQVRRQRSSGLWTSSAFSSAATGAF